MFLQRGAESVGALSTAQRRGEDSSVRQRGGAAARNQHSKLRFFSTTTRLENTERGGHSARAASARTALLRTQLLY